MTTKSIELYPHYASSNARCSSCGAPIIWATTAELRRMPLDAEPSENGTFFLFPSALGALVPPECAHHKADSGRVREASLLQRPRYLSHFASCPNGAQHRKPRP